MKECPACGILMTLVASPDERYTAQWECALCGLVLRIVEVDDEHKNHNRSRIRPTNKSSG
jgi:transcription initiation factor TFIIIB Brf1 subunit/transcription initiation factor TFIIB